MKFPRLIANISETWLTDSTDQQTVRSMVEALFAAAFRRMTIVCLSKAEGRAATIRRQHEEILRLRQVVRDLRASDRREQLENLSFCSGFGWTDEKEEEYRRSFDAETDRMLHGDNA